MYDVCMMYVCMYVYLLCTYVFMLCSIYTTKILINIDKYWDIRHL